MPQKTLEIKPSNGRIPTYRCPYCHYTLSMTPDSLCSSCEKLFAKGLKQAAEAAYDLHYADAEEAESVPENIGETFAERRSHDRFAVLTAAIIGLLLILGLLLAVGLTIENAQLRHLLEVLPPVR